MDNLPMAGERYKNLYRKNCQNISVKNDKNVKYGHKKKRLCNFFED